MPGLFFIKLDEKSSFGSLLLFMGANTEQCQFTTLIYILWSCPQLSMVRS